MAKVAVYNVNQLNPESTFLKSLELERRVAPSLGPSLVAQDGLREGHSVKMIDHLSLFKEGTPKVDIGVTGFDFLQRINPDVLGVNIMTSTRKPSLKFIQRVNQKMPHTKIVVGGAHPTLLPEQILNHYPVEVVLRGESDKTFGKVVSALGSETPETQLKTIPNLSFALDGGIVHTEDLSIYDNLDTQAIPDYNSLYGGGIETASVVTTMGCYYNKCRYCSSKSLAGPRLRSKSLSRILREVDELARQGIKTIQFEDSTMTYDLDRTKKLFRELARRRLTYTLVTRFDRIDEELVNIFSRGDIYLELAVETGSESLRNKMGKKLSNQRILEGANLLNTFNIPFGVYIMLGFPGESREKMEETESFLERIHPGGISAAVLQLNPGSMLYQEAARKGLIRETDFLDLEKPVYHWYRGKKLRKIVDFAHGLNKRFGPLPRFESSNWGYFDSAE